MISIPIKRVARICWTRWLIKESGYTFWINYYQQRQTRLRLDTLHNNWMIVSNRKGLSGTSFLKIIFCLKEIQRVSKILCEMDRRLRNWVMDHPATLYFFQDGRW